MNFLAVAPNMNFDVELMAPLLKEAFAETT